MSENITSCALCPQWEYVVPTNSGSYDYQLGEKVQFGDIDVSSGSTVINGDGVRKCVLVKNGSGGNLSPGAALNWVTGAWGTQVQACPAGSEVRCFVPGYIRGSTSNVVPNGAYFYAVYAGYTSILSDGTAIAVNDAMTIGAVSGQLRTNYGLGGGAVFTQMVPSTVLTNTTVATKYDQNFTFPARSLNAGDVVRVNAEVSVILANSTNTLLTELMLGSQVIGTLAAFDPTDAGGDIIGLFCDITIRTAGASGTMVAYGQFIKNVNGTVTTTEFQLGTLGAAVAIDTTVTQQLAIRGTWSVANANNQSRQDQLEIMRINAGSSTNRSPGTCIVAAAGGSSVQFRASVNCLW